MEPAILTILLVEIVSMKYDTKYSNCIVIPFKMVAGLKSLDDVLQKARNDYSHRFTLNPRTPAQSHFGSVHLWGWFDSLAQGRPVDLLVPPCLVHV